MTMSKARAAREAIEKIEQAKPKLGQRLAVISACCDCAYSRDTSACFHPDTGGRADMEGRPPFNDGSGQPFRCFRPLPPVPKGVGGFPEYQTPPDWCPLIQAAPELALREIVEAAREINDGHKADHRPLFERNYLDRVMPRLNTSIEKLDALLTRK